MFIDHSSNVGGFYGGGNSQEERLAKKTKENLKNSKEQ